ncbi:MAG TPA: helix-turn-helix transcriptional regulator [Streptosporangiaceae bacterium]|nr:helix-turn-helix transcriptional regulator [Streptosporangiaceae bacterium]
MASTTFAAVLAKNLRAARARAGISQQVFAARMRALGYDQWLYQTVGNIERGKRRISADELLGCAVAAETTLHALLSPSSDDLIVELPGGGVLPVASVQRSARGINDAAVRWDNDRPIFTTEPLLHQAVADGTATWARVHPSGEVDDLDRETGTWERRAAQ